MFCTWLDVNGFIYRLIKLLRKLKKYSYIFLWRELNLQRLLYQKARLQWKSLNEVGELKGVMYTRWWEGLYTCSIFDKSPKPWLDLLSLKSFSQKWFNNCSNQILDLISLFDFWLILFLLLTSEKLMQNQWSVKF